MKPLYRCPFFAFRSSEAQRLRGLCRRMCSLMGDESQHCIVHFGEELIALLYISSVPFALAEFHVSDRRRVVGIVQPATLDAIRLGHDFSKLVLQ